MTLELLCAKQRAVSAASFHRSAFILTLTSLLLGMSARAQKPEEMTEHTSTLGLRFVALPSIPTMIATHETRVSDWQAFLASSKHEWSYKPHFEQTGEHPVVGVTLQDARAFCGWLTDKDRAEGKINASQSYRLPTVNEWDAAVGLIRARKQDLSVEEKLQDERIFPWGAAWPPPAKAANLAEAEIPGYEDGFVHTAPVGQFTATPEGIHDLGGNVWEWCWDAEVSAEQTGVLRGGSWAYFRPECLTSAYFYAVPADMRMPTIGFRCVFEDRQRTAVLLVRINEERAKQRAQQRKQIMGGDVAKEELEAMKKKLAGAAESSNLPDPASLKPVVKDQRFQNTLGMEFIPLAGSAGLMGMTETRVQDYEAWLKDSGRTWEKKPPFLLGATHAAVGLSWDDATAFCEWLTLKDRAAKLIPEGARYRLPTDLEWSLAVGLKDEPGTDPAQRSGTATALHFPWSAEGVFPPQPLSTNLDASRIPGYSDTFSYTSPVLNESANALGIHGLSGNAAEWCADVWPGSPDERVLRGGSWLSYDRAQLLSSYRQHAPKDTPNAGFGFRVFLDLGSP